MPVPFSCGSTILRTTIARTSRLPWPRSRSRPRLTPRPRVSNSRSRSYARGRPEWAGLFIFRLNSDVIDSGPNSTLPRAVSTAEERPLRLDPMSDDLARTVLADRRQFVDGALEAVERVGLAGRNYLERHVIIVPAHLTSSH